MRPTLIDLKAHLYAALERQKETIGFNLAALKFIKSQHTANKTAEIYERDGIDLDDHAVQAKINDKAPRKRKLLVA